VIGCDDSKRLPNKEATMIRKNDFNRQVRRTVLLTVGLLSALIFGMIVLAGGDWIPGTLIVAASLIGLASQVRVINKLCNQAPPQRVEHRGRAWTVGHRGGWGRLTRSAPGTQALRRRTPDEPWEVTSQPRSPTRSLTPAP
jgi:hypothetical protein